MQQTNPKIMKSKLIVFVAILTAIPMACSSKPAAENIAAARPRPTASATAVSPTPVPTPATAKNGDYPGKGVVTKINLEGEGSVEMDHEEIKDVMPAMKMEFFVSDKKLLNGLKIGDKVDFTLRYKDHTEKIVDIKKAQ